MDNMEDKMKEQSKERKIWLEKEKELQTENYFRIKIDDAIEGIKDTVSYGQTRQYIVTGGRTNHYITSDYCHEMNKFARKVNKNEGI